MLAEAEAEAEAALGVEEKGAVVVTAAANWHPGVVGLARGAAEGAIQPPGLRDRARARRHRHRLGPLHRRRRPRPAPCAARSATGCWSRAAATPWRRASRVKHGALARIPRLSRKRAGRRRSRRRGRDQCAADRRRGERRRRQCRADRDDRAGRALRRRQSGAGGRVARHTSPMPSQVGQAHVRARLRSGDGTMLNAIAFRALGQPLGQALIKNRGQPLHAAGTLSIDRWNGGERVQLRLMDVALPPRGDERAGGRPYSPSESHPGLRAKGSRVMSKLNLSVAIGDYDRNRPLIDGAVQIDGVDPVFMKLYPEEIFFRAFRSEDFDICECSLSSFTVKTAAGNCPYVGVPAFVSRMFRHTSIYVRTDRIKKPQDLRARRSACRSISSPPTSGRARCWRTISV